LDHKEFGEFRQRLQKTQKQMASLLGTSLKAVQSFEQGWRKVPAHIERQVLFLLSSRRGAGRPGRCWDIRNCAPEIREACPAWEFGAGGLCWFINGTTCAGKAMGTWAKKMRMCRKCEVFARAMQNRDSGPRGRGKSRAGRKREGSG